MKTITNTFSSFYVAKSAIRKVCHFRISYLLWLKSIEHTVSSTLSSYGDCSTAIYSVPGAIWKQWSFLVLRTSPDHLPFITTVLSPAHGLAALWLRSFSGVWNPPEICQDTLCPLTLLSVCLCGCCLSKLLSLLPPKCSSHSPCSQWSHELLWPWPRLGRAHYPCWLSHCRLWHRGSTLHAEEASCYHRLDRTLLFCGSRTKTAVERLDILLL